MSTALKDLKKLYKIKIDNITQISTKYSFAELIKIIHSKEKVEFISSAFYKKSLGLLVITNERIVYSSRTREREPQYFQFKLSELTNILIEISITQSNLRFITSFSDITLTNVLTAEAKQAYEILNCKITEKKKELNIGDETLLDLIFNRENGWSFTESQIPLFRKSNYDSVEYIMTLNELSITVTHEKRQFQKLINSLDNPSNHLSSIILTHKINTLLQKQIILVKQELPKRLTSTIVHDYNNLFISTSFPLVKSLSIESIRNQLLANIFLIIERRMDIDKLLNVPSIKSQNSKATEIAKTESKFGFMDFIDLVGTVIDIASVISGGDTVSEE